MSQISLFYFNLQDLIEDIKSELSGDYKDAILACFVSPAYYDARSIKKAIYVSNDFCFSIVKLCCCFFFDENNIVFI